MKKIIFIVILLTGFLSAQLPFASAAEAERWRWITATDELALFFDTDTIKYDRHQTFHGSSIDKNIIRFYLEVEYSDMAIQKIIETMKNNGYRQGAWENLSCAIAYMMLDVEKQLFHPEYVTFYTADGTALITWHGSICNWQAFLPGTRGETVYQVITSYATDHDEDLTQRSD